MIELVRAMDWRCWVACGLCALSGCAGTTAPRTHVSTRTGTNADALTVRDAAPASSLARSTHSKPVDSTTRPQPDSAREPLAVTTARERWGTGALATTATANAISHRVAAKIEATAKSSANGIAVAKSPVGATSNMGATGSSKSTVASIAVERATSPARPREGIEPVSATPTIASSSPRGIKRIPDLTDPDKSLAEQDNEIEPSLVELTAAADVARKEIDDATRTPRPAVASGLRHVSAHVPSGMPSVRTPAPPLVPPASDGVPVPAVPTETAPAPGSAPSLSVTSDFTLPAGYQLSLANILQLAGAQNPNIALAQERILESYARVDRAESLWLPSLRAGLNYNHHEGRIQDVAGNVIETTRSSAFAGLGANAVGAGSPAVPGLVAQFHLTDAIFQPRIASHHAASRQFNATVVRNNTLRDAAVAYFELIRAERAFAIAHEALQNTAKLELLTLRYAEAGQGLRSDHHRVETELALRQEQCETEREAVTVASARLAQILHVDPAALISSGEPAVVPLEVLPVKDSAMSFVALGLSRRPELCEQRHLVGEAVERLRREQYAPLIPSVLLGMSYGGLGGGLGSKITNSGDRWDADAVAYWEVRNFGIGERAARNETSSIVRQARLREVVLLDNVAREVAESHAQVMQRQRRVELVRKGIPAAERSYALNTERIENLQGLPIEALQAIQSLATARKAYLNAVIDYNVAQFELCRATGWFLEG